MKSLTKFLSIFSLCVIAHEATSATVITKLNFDDGVIPNGNGWSFGAQAGGQVLINTNKAENHNGSAGSIKALYPLATGGMYAWGGYSLTSLKTREIYIDFWAKMPKATQGLKFCKLFGVTGAGTGYANTTFGLGAEVGRAGSFFQVSFGDGSELDNDTGSVVNLDGAYPEWVGRSYANKTARVETPQKSAWLNNKWGTDWHHFRMHAKFNSDINGKEVADGEYYLEIDNVVYVRASGLLNRHVLNKPLDRIGFFDWSQGGTTPFEVWLDDIVISTDGFVDVPNPPQGVRLY